MTPFNDDHNNFLPKTRYVEAQKHQSVNETLSTPIAGNPHANLQTKRLTTTMEESLGCPSTSSTYLSPKVMPLITRLKKLLAIEEEKPPNL